MVVEDQYIPEIEENIEVAENPTEKVYFVGLAAYILLYLQYETQWEYFDGVPFILQAVTLLALGVNFFLSLQHFEGAQMPIVLLSFLVCMAAGINSDKLFILTTAFLLIFGAKDIPFRKIVRVYLVVGGTFCAITVLSSLMGIIPNLTDIVDAERESVFVNYERQCLGYGWSTNMANHVFFIIIAYFYYVGRLLKKREILLFFFIGIWVYGRSDSRLSTILIVLLLLFSWLYNWGIVRRIVASFPSKLFLFFSIPLFATVSYYATVAYDSTDMGWMVANALLSGRLRIGQEAIEEVGTPLFGQVFEMFSSARADGSSYNYLDSSYIQSLVIYGVVLTLLMIVAYVVIIRQAFKRNDILLIMSIIFVGISGMIAQHFIEFYMNPFLIALYASHDDAGVLMPASVVEKEEWDAVDESDLEV